MNICKIVSYKYIHGRDQNNHFRNMCFPKKSRKRVFHEIVDICKIDIYKYFHGSSNNHILKRNTYINAPKIITNKHILRSIANKSVEN